MLFSRAYDRLNESTIGELADELRAAGVPNPRNAIIEDLANCRPDRRVVYEVEPEPELTPCSNPRHFAFAFPPNSDSNARRHEAGSAPYALPQAVRPKRSASGRKAKHPCSA